MALKTMKRSTKTWLIALGVFAAYVLLAIVVAYALKLHGTKLWVLVLSLTGLGLLSAGILLWYLRDTLRTPKAGTPASGIDALLAAARAQLASKRGGGKPNFGALPVLLVVGPHDSTKTTTVVRSGLEPELLAGDVFRGETVTPTPHANVWFAQNSLVVEAGGPLFADAPGWQRLIHALRPRSLSSALTGKPQPPRLAVVCFPCDEFYKPGSGENVPNAARMIRARLGEAAKQFGVPLPTYVVFTKLDSVPHFTDYTRNLSNDEARDPLGAAVSPYPGSAGTYADRVTPVLEQSFGALYASLAERRLVALTREHGAEFKPGAYEFAREFNKLRALTVDFLREVGRPSELEVSPLLRGFYFTGVQAVFVTTAAAEYTPAPQPQMAGVRSATGVMGPLGAALVPAAPAQPAAGARKIPRWDFLPRVMREVVFGDQAAVRITQVGARVGFWRRLGFGLATVVAIFLGAAFVWSYTGNSDLQSSALAATRGIASLPPNPVDLPALDALQKLDALRQQVDTLSSYEHDGAPTGLTWGLYSGGKLYPEVRNAYFASFNKLMFAGTRSAMLVSLRGLPDVPRPTDDYGETYNLLKTYLITTTHPEKSTPALAPALLTRWLGGRTIDSARAQIARRQFETYANELRYANPFPDTADAPTVAKARSFLRRFGGSESIYQYMLAEAAKTNPSIQFNRKFPGSAQVVVASHEVPGAFTKGGATFMLNAFKTVDQFLKGEGWVVGEDAGGVDKAKLVAELQGRYAADYAAEWRKFLSTAQVVRYSGMKDASSKLAVLSGNQSPLLALFFTASQNTNIPLPEVATVFQPVQLLTPPTVTDKLIGEKNQSYINALLAFQSALDMTASAQGAAAAEQAAGQAAASASSARTAAKQIASGFNIDQQGNVQAVVQNLMEAPITYAEPYLKNVGASEINTRARAFCSAARQTLAKFPFAADATQQASLAEVTALLKPGSGSLWKFYDEVLAASVPRQGNQFVPSPGGTVKLTPGFVAFLNKAAQFADIVFKDNSPEPRISFTVQPAPGDPFASVSVSLDGEVVRSTSNGNIQSARIDWPGGQREARLAAGGVGAEITLVGPFTGTWAVFQLFNAADDWRPVQNGYRVGWEIRTTGQRATTATGQSARVVVQIDAGPANVVLRRGFFSGSECGGEIAR